jgi:hypothetical protein
MFREIFRFFGHFYNFSITKSISEVSRDIFLMSKYFIWSLCFPVYINDFSGRFWKLRDILYGLKTLSSIYQIF